MTDGIERQPLRPYRISGRITDSQQHVQVVIIGEVKQGCSLSGDFVNLAYKVSRNVPFTSSLQLVGNHKVGMDGNSF